MRSKLTNSQEDQAAAAHVRADSLVAPSAANLADARAPETMRCPSTLALPAQRAPRLQATASPSASKHLATRGGSPPKPPPPASAASAPGPGCQGAMAPRTTQPQRRQPASPRGSSRPHQPLTVRRRRPMGSPWPTAMPPIRLAMSRPILQPASARALPPQTGADRSRPADGAAAPASCGHLRARPAGADARMAVEGEVLAGCAAPCVASPGFWLRPMAPPRPEPLGAAAAPPSSSRRRRAGPRGGTAVRGHTTAPRPAPEPWPPTDDGALDALGCPRAPSNSACEAAPSASPARGRARAGRHKQRGRTVGRASEKCPPHACRCRPPPGVGRARASLAESGPNMGKVGPNWAKTGL